MVLKVAVFIQSNFFFVIYIKFADNVEGMFARHIRK